MKMGYCISSAGLFYNLFDTVFLFQNVGKDFLLVHCVERGIIHYSIFFILKPCGGPCS